MKEKTLKIEDVVKFKACITCVYRKPYPAITRKNGELVFYRFWCGMAMDSSKELVGPEEVCGFWRGATPGVE